VNKIETEILEKIDQERSHVIWLSEGPLCSKLKAFVSLNYILDDQLSYYLSHPTSSYARSLFGTDSFSGKIVVIHLNLLQEKNPAQKIQEILHSTKETSAIKKILCITEDLPEKYNQLKDSIQKIAQVCYLDL